MSDDRRKPRTIRIECEAAPENWFDFKMNITRRTYNRYMDALLPDEEARALRQQMEPDELKADDQARKAVVQDVLREVVHEAQFVIEDEEIQGIEAILEHEDDTLPMYLESFLVSAFQRAMVELRALGNARRAG